MPCDHDWRLSRERVIDGKHAGLIVLCHDCPAVGIILDASPLEIQRTIAAADDPGYRPIYFGARDRIALLGDRTPEPPAAPEMNAAKMQHLAAMTAKRIASVDRAKRAAKATSK